MCVQNLYDLAHRQDDGLIDALAERGIAYVPYFPLGGFSPLQSAALSGLAARLETTPMSVALAWLQRSPNILLMPGTSSTQHLRENVAGAALSLSADDLAELDKIGHRGGSARAAAGASRSAPDCSILRAWAGAWRCWRAVSGGVGGRRWSSCCAPRSP